MKGLDFKKFSFCIVTRRGALLGGLLSERHFIIHAVCESKSAAEKYIEEWAEKEQEKNQLCSADKIQPIELPEIITLPLWRLK